eukprot:CAMPEP_0119316494 /NCGR_PEP_ID=MMETSP1333-20130426/39803_1 /TAXON_ID=418940 /ORGANISM="Scyphosphaera apsteinii, Strain RCC1455" /LENGTH=103 /DNA_ID=CAMNT_0007322155 /DNA_START=235 /DNA_END=546 /DNA_ORIENTATION=+
MMRAEGPATCKTQFPSSGKRNGSSNSISKKSACWMLKRTKLDSDPRKLPTLNADSARKKSSDENGKLWYAATDGATILAMVLSKGNSRYIYEPYSKPSNAGSR